MRLWSLNPEYLDRIGLIALWREGLLAKKVLEGKTKGYKNHPQLLRFKNYNDPLNAINAYLYFVYKEAEKRGYKFNRSKIKPIKLKAIIPVTEGQLKFEFNYLIKKLKERAPLKYNELRKKKIKLPLQNPVFYTIKGKKEAWEKS